VCCARDERVMHVRAGLDIVQLADTYLFDRLGYDYTRESRVCTCVCLHA
jgi:hypothetical protein